MESSTDNTLMKLVQAGDSAQLATLFERYHLGLFRYVFSLTRNRALSEDLVQEVFFRVLKYARSYDPSLSFPVWLYGMARNACFDTLRKRGSELTGTEMGDVRSSAPMPEEEVARKQDVMLLHEALEQLPEEKREVLILSRFHNMRYEEIARILKCEVGTVKVRVYRALKDLREKFNEVSGDTRRTGAPFASGGEKLYDV